MELETLSRELRETRASLEQCRRHYAELCDFFPGGYLTLDEHGCIREINLAGARLLGTTRPALIGRPLRDYVADNEVAVFLEQLAHCRPGDAASVTEINLIATDGGSRPVQLYYARYEDAGQSYYRIALVDVSEHRWVEMALQKTADDLHDLYQNAPCGYHSLDPDGMVIQINDTELNWLGYARTEVLGKMRFTELISPPYRDPFDSTFALLKERGWVRNIQLELRRKDGTILPVLLNSMAVRDGRGRFLHSRASIFDITQRKLAEEEARRYAQRLQAISRRLVEVQESERQRLAGELHDRVGQNLTALNINLNIMRAQISQESALKVGARLEDSLKLVEATVETIRDVMAELRPAVLDDYGLCATLRWYAKQFAQRTGVNTTVAGRDPTPRLSPAVEGALFRIAQESLTNVAKYAQARQARILLKTQSQGFCLTIADNGCGFDPATCPPPSNHHGWGLMIMQERAKAVGGQLRVESAIGQGTRVVVEVRA